MADAEREKEEMRLAARKAREEQLAHNEAALKRQEEKQRLEIQLAEEEARLAEAQRLAAIEESRKEDAEIKRKIAARKSAMFGETDKKTGKSKKKRPKAKADRLREEREKKELEDKTALAGKLQAIQRGRQARTRTQGIRDFLEQIMDACSTELSDSVCFEAAEINIRERVADAYLDEAVELGIDLAFDGFVARTAAATKIQAIQRGKRTRAIEMGFHNFVETDVMDLALEYLVDLSFDVLVEQLHTMHDPADVQAIQGSAQVAGNVWSGPSVLSWACRNHAPMHAHSDAEQLMGEIVDHFVSHTLDVIAASDHYSMKFSENDGAQRHAFGATANLTMHVGRQELALTSRLQQSEYAEHDRAPLVTVRQVQQDSINGIVTRGRINSIG